MLHLRNTIFANAGFHGYLIMGLLLCLAFAVFPKETHASTLSLGPGGGSFTVGSTFTVSLFLDTEGEAINALDVEIRFPPDKLQLVSPSLGQSLVTVWTAPPSYDNLRGSVTLQGGIPGGANMSRGLVTTLTFRARAPGTAVVRIDDAKVLLNDGNGTDSLNQTENGVYSLELPPPQGPVVSSETHQDQRLWYNTSDVILSWGLDERSDAYSYVLDRQPVTTPDNIADGEIEGVTYRGLDNGVHYFHIKALRGGVWGGTTHFAIRVDTEPPAEFPLIIEPSKRTSSRSPILRFATTDAHSGLSYTEVKVIPLTHDLFDAATAEAHSEPFFVEASSPYVLHDVPRGSYDVVVRSYDVAGNIRDAQERLKITTPFLGIAGSDGIYIKETFILSWSFVLLLLILLLGGLGYAAWHVRDWRKALMGSGGLAPHVEDQLKELKVYRRKYGKLMKAIVFFAALWLLPSLVWGQGVAPPQIDFFPGHISNEEIFYVGGQAQTPDTDVVIYLQNERSGEIVSVTVLPDEKGEWFYRHHGFLDPGSYRVWVQGIRGETVSPPSPESSLVVEATALQFGASRVSRETLYLALFALMSILALLLLAYTLFTYRAARKQHRAVREEIREAEESLRRGFAVLRRDIEEELRSLREGGVRGGQHSNLASIEAELIADLAAVESRIGKEIWDIDEAERS